MSMVLFASVVRVRDGLPLSASTDFEQNKGVQEVKKHLKVLSKKLGHLPDRCTLKGVQHNIHFISSLGLGYMMICSENYPNVLAFCFLDELQREFITLYDTMRINIAVRPYSFIEFDNFIQKTKQRYNNPRSLATKINLADMQTEIKLRPSHQLTMLDVGTVNGSVNPHAAPYKGIAPNQRLEPVTLPGIISCLLCVLCAALNLIRGFHAMENVFQDDEEEFNNVAVFFIGTAACLYQCYLLACYVGRRNLKSFLMFGLVCLCNLYLHELRNTWQILFHVTVAAFATLQTRMRQPQGKAPDYNV
ncbi:vesicle-trafficking protein SEC22a isoform X1 [Carcharodon carcharias]|uniref:vesicle-trafficking protein SEC22a isoform X1 n=1 Tax=Carcharodon carcharias TaxID=13397 RepID=UPI001B7F0F8C|nr:vesicle-trafficking protein SEC22a isoform X1 [Carcharodon carcharias]XP_041057671.1 vesicle-trafficking protein SEC22a isoform X1 [Carcharodon carcharias]XP_041057672.1 vesicle-trafficking protein SEC22a isoform X1 [Carcharodon carcharias]XP_041057673.1 vesicle-trafficking protein SEC22a isoform X1 [Carcharodon carcharias]